MHRTGQSPRTPKTLSDNILVNASDNILVDAIDKAKSKQDGMLYGTTSMPLIKIYYVLQVQQ